MQYSRRRKLIRPALQLKLALVFTVTGCIAILIQGLLLHRSMMHLSAQLPAQELALLSAWPSVLTGNLILTSLVLVPLTVGIGVLATFPVTGPIHRFEAYLRQVAGGENPGPVKIRKSDELHRLCDLINGISVPYQELRKQQEGPLESAEEAAETDPDSIPSLVQDKRVSESA